jgi:hypothetical protein
MSLTLLMIGRAHAQFIPQKKHRRSQAAAEQIGPDVHGLPIPDSASHADTPPQKSDSNKSEKFSAIHYDGVMEQTKVKS